MKALVYTAPNHLEFRDEPAPRPGHDEVLVRVDAVGICGSDLHAYRGHDNRRPAPLILGHEVAGVVQGGQRDGQRVTVNPLVTCGRCRACLAGRSNLCASREIISMAPRQGAFAEWIAIPDRNLVPLPDALSITTAALAEPIATGLHAVAVAARAVPRPLSELRVAVLGAGAVGLGAALVLHSHGCRDIVVADTNPGRRATAQRTGLFQVCDPLAAPPEANSADVIIDAVGGGLTRAAASAMIRPGGVIVHIGLQDSSEGLDIRKITLQEVTVIGTYTYTMSDFHATVAAMADGRLGPLDWFEEHALAHGNAAFADLVSGKIAAAKVILRPSSTR